VRSPALSVGVNNNSVGGSWVERGCIV
jgi:hypothetical protein